MHVCFCTVIPPHPLPYPPHTQLLFCFLLYFVLKWQESKRENSLGTWQMPLLAATMGKGALINCTLSSIHIQENHFVAFDKQPSEEKWAVVWDAAATEKSSSGAWICITTSRGNPEMLCFHHLAVAAEVRQTPHSLARRLTEISRRRLTIRVKLFTIRVKLGWKYSYCNIPLHAGNMEEMGFHLGSHRVNRGTGNLAVL